MLPLLLVVMFSASVFGQSTGVITGIVVDPSGAAVPDAVVRLHSPSDVIGEFLTGIDGRFEFITQPPPALLRIAVTATGFSPVVVPVASDAVPLRVVLQTATFFEAVNVTSSRTTSPRVDPTATLTVFSATDLQTSGALTLDDALKTVPGFTLFRRTSSRVSNPTAQGVTLRGLGGTGASRSLVLADGVPLNDAFGGWVYWDKLPQVAIDRVEVLRGSGSDLYGADAIGGVIQILTWHPSSRAARGLVEGGSLGTGRVSLFGGSRSEAWSYTAGGEWFTTSGYVAVARQQDAGLAPRGPIDTKLGSTHRSGIGSLEYETKIGWRVNAGALVFTNSRLNGTPAVINDTASRQGTGGAAGALAGGHFSARGYLGTQGYDQTFSAVSSDRTSEDLNRRQRVPTRVAGTAVQWVRAVGRHALLVGAEGRFIKGNTQEIQLSAGRVLAAIDAGGTQHVWSTYLQDTFHIGDRLTIVVGGHADRWHTQSQNRSYDRTLGSFNPRAAMAYRVADGIALRGSAYKGFRAPTLNELYRGFRAGNTQTNPNEALVPERLTGGEAGLLATRRALSARVTGFWNVLDDVITNVTLSSTPQLITKQRANADKMRTAGVEVEAAVRLPASVFMSFSGAIVDARYKGNTSLRGNRVPQVPAYNLGLNVRYSHGAWLGSGQLRMTGMQFEDDLNAFQLRRATVLDVFGSRALSGKLSAFVSVENVLDGEHDVGRTPILTIGLPRAARVGVYISLP